MAEFVMQRNKIVRSLSGHVINFVKGERTHVPFAAVSECVAAGAVSVDEEFEIEDTEEAAAARLQAARQAAEADPETRKLKIVEAFEKLIAKNGRNDFSADGRPHPKAVTREVGFDVDSKERNAVWIEFMDKG